MNDSPNSQSDRTSSRSRGGLGRGLGALIPRGHGGGLEVDVGRIQPNPDQPRQTIAEAALVELADSIREHGVLQPLIVTQGEGNEHYVLIAGERRWRAAQRAGLRTVPVVVRESTPQQRMLVALVENLQREDLTPLEQAAAYRQLLDEHALGQEELAARVGKSRAAVANTLRLLNLPEEALNALASGQITEGHARALLGCSDPRRLGLALHAVLSQELTVRQTEELARRLNQADLSTPGLLPLPLGEGRGEGSAASPGQRSDRDAAALEDRLRQALGTKVQLFRSRRGGRLVIHFYDDDQLAGILQTLSR